MLSRSYYKGNYQCITKCESNKRDKQMASRKLRRRCKILIRVYGVEVCLDHRNRAYTNNWLFGKEYVSWYNDAYTHTRRGRSK